MKISPSLEKHPRLSAWLDFGTEGRVTIRTGKVDIGQRISTAIAIIGAEELDLDLSRIDVARVETDGSPDEGYSSGSNSIEESGQAVRCAAATAKRWLLARAAEALEVDPDSLEAADGLIRSRLANRSTTYWELARDGLGGVTVDPGVVTKSPEDFRQIGRPIVALGLRDLVTGHAVFVQDMTLPRMLHARVVRPPHYHARLQSLNESCPPGTRLVRDGSFLAVAAEDEYAAVRAALAAASAARWILEPSLDRDDIYSRLRTNPRVSLPVVDGIPRETSLDEPDSRPPETARTVTAEFERPYTMHGAIGPSAAVALFEANRLTVWTHSQGIYPLRAAIAETLELDQDRVRLIHAPGPGCYGHNGADDAALDAALVARAIPGRPVLLKWTREDEHAWEPYGSCMVVKVRAHVDGRDRIIDWCHESYSDTHINRPRVGPDRAGPRRLLATRYLEKAAEPFVPAPNMGRHAGIHRNADPYYNFPGRRIVKHLVRNLPLRTSTLRTLGAYANVFAIESVMDEVAVAAGADPLEFRLGHLDDPRAREVLEAAAKHIGWRRGSRPAGHGTGIAFARYKNEKAYAAVAVGLEVGDDARVILRRVVIAADAGQIVDPGGLATQLEGGFLQAASWTLHEEVTWDESGITSRDWESYPILRFDNVPEIETVLIDRPGAPWLGVGEATGGPTAAAISNAIFDAVGLRLRRLPFRPDAIRAAALR
jgi:CO/xanthine dehydrogenase Mo-binding subunit